MSHSCNYILRRNALFSLLNLKITESEREKIRRVKTKISFVVFFFSLSFSLPEQQFTSVLFRHINFFFFFFSNAQFFYATFSLPHFPFLFLRLYGGELDWYYSLVENGMSEKCFMRRILKINKKLLCISDFPRFTFTWKVLSYKIKIHKK